MFVCAKMKGEQEKKTGLQRERNSLVTRGSTIRNETLKALAASVCNKCGWMFVIVWMCVDGIMSLANRNKSQCQFPNDPFQLCLSSAYSLTYNENVPDLNEKQSQGKNKKRDIVNRLTNDNANICSVSVYTVTFWFFYLCLFFTLFLSKSVFFGFIDV